MHIGKKHEDKVHIRVVRYNRDTFEKSEVDSIEEAAALHKDGEVTWINIDGLHDVATIEAVGAAFHVHPLILEDILNTGQRPKTEEIDGMLQVSAKMIGMSKDKRNIVIEQISFLLGDGILISFQERRGDVFDGLRGRLEEGKGIARDHGADYLMYRLLDTVVDNYFYVTDHINQKCEKLEDQAFHDASETTLKDIQRIRKKLIELRRVILPLRETTASLLKDDLTRITEPVRRYLRDVNEHVIQVVDTIDTQRDLISSITDLYLNGISNRMNQVMKVLTIIATIFIPLTFVAGIYGMNFKHMPELEWEYGYYAVWGVMALLVIAMIFYFKKRKWL